ncbi:hypothetical protein MUK42_36901 [Musa troglodytarum]|uniref:Uncharacterized protein n=1 Tax=Musa troglodytarum TaxID=320322 RepID=A0A9E7EGU0_9LILI|nr:hypothetical protein MUK42_36901 [Musa troglodytarum]
MSLSVALLLLRQSMGDLTRGPCHRRRKGNVTGCLEMQFNLCSESSRNLLRLKLKEMEAPASLINASISLHLDLSMMYRHVVNDQLAKAGEQYFWLDSFPGDLPRWLEIFELEILQTFKAFFMCLATVNH